jgi:hypothetical protein
MSSIVIEVVIQRNWNRTVIYLSDQSMGSGT